MQADRAPGAGKCHSSAVAGGLLWRRTYLHTPLLAHSLSVLSGLTRLPMGVPPAHLRFMIVTQLTTDSVYLHRRSNYQMLT